MRLFGLIRFFAGSNNQQLGRQRSLRFESLEERQMLTTTMFLDFGGGIGMGSVLSSTAGALRNIDGIGIYGLGTGPDLFIPSSSSVNFRPLSYDFDLNGTINNADITALANAVLPLVQRALEPFDIDVVVTGTSTIAGIVTSLDANNAATNGKNDAYVMIADVRSSYYGGGSVGFGSGSFGLAALDDLQGNLQHGTGNAQDEVAFTYADVILSYARSSTGVATGASAVLNENLINRIAFTATHEAMHTFGLIHTVGTGSQDLLSAGDVVRTLFTPSTENPTRENPFTITRKVKGSELLLTRPIKAVIREIFSLAA